MLTVTTMMTDLPVPDDGTPDGPPGGEDPAPSVEAYEAEDGVVLYDARNPLAWLEGNNATSIEGRR